MSEIVQSIQAALSQRFGERLEVDSALSGLDELSRLAGRRVHRRWLEREVAPDLLRLLCACALSAPSKSDLQQGDIVISRDKAIARASPRCIRDMPWIADAPVFLVFLANGRRLPPIVAMRGKPFPNDHLDLFFNATRRCGHRAGDLHPRRRGGRSRLLPDQRDPRSCRAGERPAGAARQGRAGRGPVPRLAGGAAATSRRGLGLHSRCIRTASTRATSPARSTPTTAAAQPTGPMRGSASASASAPRKFYGWSEDKARQYAEPLRADFGAFVRAKGFRLD